MCFISQCVIDGMVFQMEAPDGAGEDVLKVATENPATDTENVDEDHTQEDNQLEPIEAGGDHDGNEM
jgi:hypothetical protein